MSVLSKINKKLLLEEKKKNSSKNSILAIKKLMECDWKQEHIRPVVAECFQTLVECNDALTEQFLGKLSEAAKTIGGSTIPNYTIQKQGKKVND